MTQKLYQGPKVSIELSCAWPECYFLPDCSQSRAIDPHLLFREFEEQNRCINSDCAITEPTVREGSDLDDLDMHQEATQQGMRRTSVTHHATAAHVAPLRKLP